MPIAKRRLRNFLRHPPFEQLCFVPVWLLLGLARLAIRLLSFRRLAAALGTPMGTRAYVPLLSRAQQARARRVGALVRWVALHTPWVSDCFPQALVARLLLGLCRVPWVLCFGLTRQAGQGLAAHAWVAAGEVCVTGGRGFNQFSVVACYGALGQRELEGDR